MNHNKIVQKSRIHCNLNQKTPHIRFNQAMSIESKEKKKKNKKDKT